MNSKEPIEVGHEIADLLIAWRPSAKQSGKEISDAIIFALEHYSIESEGAREIGLRSILQHLRQQIEWRYQSI